MRIQAHNKSPRVSISTRSIGLRCFASLNGRAAIKPPPAETARTIVSIVSEGTLSTLSADGSPVGTPVSFTLDKEGHAWVTLPKAAPELGHLKKNSRLEFGPLHFGLLHSLMLPFLNAQCRCSLMVQPQTLPVRAVGSVTLVGNMGVTDESAPAFRLELEKALYFGGLDEVK